VEGIFEVDEEIILTADYTEKCVSINRINWTLISPKGDTINTDPAIGAEVTFIPEIAGEYKATAIAIGRTFDTNEIKEGGQTTKIDINEKSSVKKIQLTSPTNNATISTFPFPISFTLAEEYLGDYTALIQLDGVLDSSFNNPSQTSYSYDKSCLLSGEHEIKAILCYNSNGGYERIDSSTVNITIPDGITCEPEPEEFITVEIIFPEDSATWHTLESEVRIKAWAKNGLQRIGLSIGEQGFSSDASGIEDTISYSLEGFDLQVGIIELIGTAEDFYNNLAFDTIRFNWQP